jgi:protein-S-isoprenylcysteine O-methyltransferase Ste14
MLGIAPAITVNRGQIVNGDAGHRRRDATGKIRRVEVADRPRAAAASADVLPEAFASDAKRRNHADAGHDDTHSEPYSIGFDGMLNILERGFVWAGGAIFVGSLSLTAWEYAIRFGQARSTAGWTAVAFDALLISAFSLHHSTFAREPIKRRLARLVPTRLLRSVYVWVASGLLILVDVLWQPVGAIVYHVDGWPRWGFAIVQILGLFLIARSVRAISALELAGIRNPKMTDEGLQTDGVYRLVRHPLYFGWLVIVFGASHMTGDRLAFAILTTTYLVIAVPWEERALEREFGQSYQRYRQQVRWRILPYVY